MPQALPMLAYYAASAAGASAGWAAFASFVVSAVVADYQKQSAADKARAQASRDRTVNIRSGVAPRKLVLGTARLGGAVMYGEFVGDDLEYLDMIIALHHGDAGALTEVLGVYLDDEYVPAADLVGGVPTTGKYSGQGILENSLTEVQTLTASASITLPFLPTGDVYAIQNLGGTGIGANAMHAPLTVASVVGYVVTLSAPVTGEVWVTYRSTSNPEVPLRLQWTTGTSSQATTTWAGVSTPKWTADHRLRGVSYLRTLMRTEDRVFATGTPQPSLVCRAADGVWDPRTSTTVNGTSNPALLAAWFRRLPKADGGFGVPFDWIDWATVATAANVCDELLSVKKLVGAGYENVKRYECNTVLNLELPAADNLRVILGAMAGDFPFTGGKYRCYAGAFRAATVTLTDDDVVGDKAINFAPSTGAAAPPNVITARIYNRAKGWVEDGVPVVRNSTYVTADGREESMEIDLPACTDTRQANYLMGVRLEQMRPAMAGSLTVKGKGANLALLDTVQLALQGYEALDGLTFEVRRRTNHWNGTYSLELTEVKASTYALDADRFTAPSTNNPGDTSDLWNVTPVTLTSVVNATLMQSDGSHLDRALVTWAAHPQALVNPRGKIEVRYRAPGYEWVYAAPVPGDQTTTYIGPLGIGMVIFVEARAINSLGVPSAWSGIDPFTVTGANDVPPDITGLGFQIKPGQVVVKWNDLQGFETELRYSAVPGSWASATFLWAGVGSDYKHARPPNGTYRVWAAHRNRNFYSATPKFVDITVDDSIDSGGGGTLRLTSSRFPYFLFPTGTSHTAQAPGDTIITFTAKLVGGLVGTASFQAEAFNSGGSSLGLITMGGTGNARTLTAAQFVSLGTLGTVRTVIVTARIGAALDFLTVYRQDSTTTTPRLFIENEVAQVDTDEAGEFGDYSDAATGVLVYSGLTDVTNTFTFGIVPDSGVTATINGGAGPVSGTASVAVAVSASTVDDGAVLINATGPATLDGTFRVIKKRAGGAGYTAFFTPDEIRLPVDSAGNVSSYANAISDFTIMKAAVNDTAQWTLAKSDAGCTSTLTGNRVTVTNLATLGALGAVTSQTISFAGLGWTNTSRMVVGEGVYMISGTTGFGSNVGHVKTATSAAGPFTDRALGTTGVWKALTYATGAFLMAETEVGSTNRTLRSTNAGVSWSVVTMPVSSQWYDVRAQGATVIVTSQTSTTGCRSTNSGASYSTITMPATSCNVFPGGGTRWFARSAAAASYVSNDNGTTWTNITAKLPDVLWNAISYQGRSVITLWDTGLSRAVYTDDGVNFATVTTPSNANRGDLCVVSGVLYMRTAVLLYSVDGARWASAGASMPSGTFPQTETDLQLPHLPLMDGSSTRQVELAATSADTGFVTITATKPNEADIVRVLPVRKGLAPADVYTSQVSQASVLLPSTADGVVTSFTAGIVVAQINKNGADDTANWTITWTTTNLTPASGTGATVTLTAMTDGILSGAIYFTAAKAGQPLITGTVGVFKSYGTESSGPRIGAAFNAVTASATWIGLKFLGDGRFQIKVGSGGSYVDAGQWAGAIRSSNASAYWIRVQATGHALNSGTTGTWLAMTTDREYTLSDATSGIHRTDLQVLIGTSSSGANAVLASGALQLIVP